MTHEEIIGYLKSNTTIYGLWPEEVRKVADVIERKNFLWWDVQEHRFVPTRFAKNLSIGEMKWLVFRLSPDYQPTKKAGWVEYEVYPSFGEWMFDLPPKKEMPLKWADGMIGFGGVLYKDCSCNDLKAYHPEPWFMSPPAPCEKHGPHKPVKVRFWREK